MFESVKKGGYTLAIPCAGSKIVQTCCDIVINLMVALRIRMPLYIAELSCGVSTLLIFHQYDHTPFSTNTSRLYHYPYSKSR